MVARGLEQEDWAICGSQHRHRWAGRAYLSVSAPSATAKLRVPHQCGRISRSCTVGVFGVWGTSAAAGRLESNLT